MNSNLTKKNSLTKVPSNPLTKVPSISLLKVSSKKASLDIDTDYIPPIELLNLSPGEQVDFLGLTWRFLNENENLDENIFFSGNICQGITKLYVAEARVSCPWQIVIMCKSNNNYGIVGLMFAKPYAPDAIYESIICSETVSQTKKLTDFAKLPRNLKYKAGLVKTKFGLLLRIIMMRYANRTFGITTAYNHAANKELVEYYKKLGWKVMGAKCIEKDPISEAFTDMYLPSFFESYKSLEDSKGWPMKLCNINIDTLTANAVTEFAENKSNLYEWFRVHGTLCLPRMPFNKRDSNLNNLGKLKEWIRIENEPLDEDDN